jgi:trehalose-6-phosphate synthase
MTMLEQALPKKVLEAVDRYRAQHGIRNRVKALEQMVLEVAPEIREHPLETALRKAPRASRGSVSQSVREQFEQSRQVQAADQESWMPLETVIKRRR